MSLWWSQGGGRFLMSKVPHYAPAVLRCRLRPPHTHTSQRLFGVSLRVVHSGRSTCHAMSTGGVSQLGFRTVSARMLTPDGEVCKRRDRTSKYRGTSLIRNRHSPHHHKALGIGLL